MLIKVLELIHLANILLSTYYMTSPGETVIDNSYAKGLVFNSGEERARGVFLSS